MKNLLITESPFPDNNGNKSYSVFDHNTLHVGSISWGDKEYWFFPCNPPFALKPSELQQIVDKLNELNTQV